MPLNLNLDVDELAGLAERLHADSRAMRGAARVAANRTVRWARAQLARGLGARLRVPPAALKGRLRALASTRSRASAAVWIALRPLNIVRARPRTSGKGLRAGGDEFVGAFVGRGRFGGKAAMRRTGTDRTPLEAVSLNVVRAATPLIGADAWPRMQEQFIRFYRSELERRATRAER